MYIYAHSNGPGDFRRWTKLVLYSKGANYYSRWTTHSFLTDHIVNID